MVASAHRRADADVIVVGHSLDLDGVYPHDVRVVRVTPRQLEHIHGPGALAVLDGRAYALSTLAEARRSPPLASTPALLVMDGSGDGAAGTVVGADDVLALPVERASAFRRVNTLIELGRTRLALRFALQALEQSVEGPTSAGAISVHPPTGAAAGAEPVRPRIGSERPPPRSRPVESGRWLRGDRYDVAPFGEAYAEVARLFGLLLERQTFDQAILDGVDVGIITTDGAGRVIFLNRCAREVLARTDEALTGHDVRDVLALARGPDSILAHPGECRWAHSLRAGDREIELDLAVSRAPEAARDHFGFFFIFRDRSQEKQLEMERQRFERLAAMGTMVAGFAHEVRNPMASLRSIAESLNEELLEANVRLPHVERMLKVLERVERLVRTSLLFGRPSAPRPAAHRPWTILSAAASALLPRTGGEIVIEAESDLPDVFVDEGQIVQVLVILLNNAIDATGSARGVILRAQSAEAVSDARARSDAAAVPFVRFAVRDEGPGIPAHIMGRIFDPFFTTKAAGTGLGLSIAQQLVSENSARIELTSAVGGPTTFSVLVPVASAHAPPVSRD